MPRMQEVESTSIEAIGYDGQAHELYVRFRESGRTYVYWEVEEKVFEELLGAVSKGNYFNREIKGAYFYGPSQSPRRPIKRKTKESDRAQ